MRNVLIWSLSLVAALAVGSALALLMPVPEGARQQAPAATVLRQDAAPMVLPAPASLGGPFTLTSHRGETVTEHDFAGRYRLMYFGFTFCPDICPTDLAEMAAALDSLPAEQAERIAPIFISVDPERDTPEVLAGHMPLFSDRLIGLTGTPEAVKQAAEAFKVYYAKQPTADEDFYLVDHSAFIYLMGPEGEPISLIRHDAGVADIAAELQRVLEG